MGRNSKIEIVRTSENIKQADLYKKPGTNTFFICLNERYMNQIKEYSSTDIIRYDPQFFIKFSDSKVAELIGTFDCKLECSSDAFKIDYYSKKNISSGNYKDIPTVYMDSEILLQFDIPYKKLEEAKEYLRTHNNTVKITFIINKGEMNMNSTEIANKVFAEIKSDLDVWNDITKKTPLCPTLSLEVEREWSNGVKCTYIETEVELTADMFSIYDDSMHLVPFESSTGYHCPIVDPFIKFDDETYKVFVKYLSDNDYKLLIRHNCGPTIDFDYTIIALIGNNTFVVNMMQFSNHPVSYEIFKDYLESHNNKLELTFNFIKKNEECV